MRETLDKNGARFNQCTDNEHAGVKNVCRMLVLHTIIVVQLIDPEQDKNPNKLMRKYIIDSTINKLIWIRSKKRDYLFLYKQLILEKYEIK